MYLVSRLARLTPVFEWCQLAVGWIECLPARVLDSLCVHHAFVEDLLGLKVAGVAVAFVAERDRLLAQRVPLHCGGCDFVGAHGSTATNFRSASTRVDPMTVPYTSIPNGADRFTNTPPAQVSIRRPESSCSSFSTFASRSESALASSRSARAALISQVGQQSECPPLGIRSQPSSAPQVLQSPTRSAPASSSLRWTQARMAGRSRHGVHRAGSCASH